MTIPPASNAWLLPAGPGPDGDDIAPLVVGPIRGELVRWTWNQDQHRLLDHHGPLHLILGTEAALTVTCLDPDGLGGWARPETLQAVVGRLRGLRSPAPIPTRPSVALVAEKPMPHWKDFAPSSPTEWTAGELEKAEQRMKRYQEVKAILTPDDDGAGNHSQRHGVEVDMANPSEEGELMTNPVPFVISDELESPIARLQQHAAVYEDSQATVWHGDCLDILREMPDNSIDAIVTDPPYGLGFMGKAWDDLPPGLPWAQECLRVLKPGGHLLAFGGTRTWHRLAVAVEDAGFQIRENIAWLYGSGFPKSLDVGAAITKTRGLSPSEDEWPPEAEQVRGWGTALKPAFEPIVVARKPLVGTVASNVLAHGTGALNVDGCRVGNGGKLKWEKPRDMGYHGGTDSGPVAATENAAGRWPANVVLDGDAAAELDEQSGNVKTGAVKPYRRAADSDPMFRVGEELTFTQEASSGGASRFFPTFRYQAKAPTRERPTVVAEDGTKTAHPTVKPLALMRWLVRLVTPPGGLVLDPFAGSGTTIEAAILEGFQVIGIEREASYLPLIEARIVRNRNTVDYNEDGESA